MPALFLIFYCPFHKLGNPLSELHGRSFQAQQPNMLNQEVEIVDVDKIVMEAGDLPKQPWFFCLFRSFFLTRGAALRMEFLILASFISF